MNHSQRYKSTGSSPCRTGCDPSLEPKSSHLSSPERFPISSPSASLSIIAARSVVGPAMSPSCRDPLRFIHHSPRVAKSTPLHHRHTETHRCIKSHEDDSPSPAFNHDNLVNAAKEPTQQPHEHQRTYQRPSLSTGSTRLRSRSPPSPRTNSNAAIGTRRSTTINSGGPRNHSTGNDGRGERLPSLFAQLKAKLEAPRRPIIPAISTSPLSLPIRPIGHYDHHHHPSAQADEDYYPSTHPRSPPLYRHHPMEDPVGESVPIDRNRHYPVSDDGPWPPLANRQSQPSLFGIQCSAAGQRAYSNHNDDTERSFLRLQHEDNGRVEHRTIGNTEETLLLLSKEGTGENQAFVELGQCPSRVGHSTAMWTITCNHPIVPVCRHQCLFLS
ncbi:hypothetical protein B0O80DRAFT_81238 [Mortierella sp. GBAus27b]|nr:hypothetical protein B0O80DRAFT_81238 [Mortierella sp. GBAus27b]